MRLSNLDRVPVRIIKAEHPLPPRLPLDRMDQLDVWRDVFEGRVPVLIRRLTLLNVTVPKSLLVHFSPQTQKS